MKSFLNFLIVLCLLVCSKCSKPESGFPDGSAIPVDTSEAKIFLNENLENYKPKFVSYKNTGVVTFDFIQIKGSFINILGVNGPVPIAAGEWGKYLSFGQYKNLDHGNQVYEPIEKEKAFFKIIEIDTTTHQVKGLFEAKFKKKYPGGIINNDSYLPETLSFKGEFDTKYVVY